MIWQQEYHIPYIDFNVHQYHTGFDWKTDSRDGGNHLNYYGATKMTKYIGEYLKEHYTLEDDRHNPEYQDYEKDISSISKKLYVIKIIQDKVIFCRAFVA